MTIDGILNARKPRGWSSFDVVALVRVQRGGEVMAEARLDSLRRFQEDVREVQAGFECGIALEGFSDFQEGDVLELYHKETGRPEPQPRRPAAARPSREARPASSP